MFYTPQALVRKKTLTHEKEQGICFIIYNLVYSQVLITITGNIDYIH